MPSVVHAVTKPARLAASVSSARDLPLSISAVTSNVPR